MEKLLDVNNLRVSFNTYAGEVKAVRGVSFELNEGETLAFVGESGCGKTTCGRPCIGLYSRPDGEVLFKGKDPQKLTGKEKQNYKKSVQMVFQDPYGSLNPRMKVQDLIGEPLLIHTNMSAGERLKKVHELLGTVGLSPSHGERYPHEFSGGQRQRIGIARALAVEPKFIIADEPVSALDVSIQAQILNILMDLKDEFHFSYLFIAHDLSVVKHISDSLGVMYLGTIVERAPKRLLFSNPVHPYTKALFSSAPTIDEGSIAESQELRGEIPSPIHLPSGCPFHDRCPMACPDCAREVPELKEVEPGHFAACHLL